MKAVHSEFFFKKFYLVFILQGDLQKKGKRERESQRDREKISPTAGLLSK